MSFVERKFWYASADAFLYFEINCAKINPILLIMADADCTSCARACITVMVIVRKQRDGGRKVNVNSD